MKALMFILGFVVTLNSAFAGGKGNGGCTVCIESYNLGVELAAEILVIGNKKIISEVPLLKDVKYFYDMAVKRKVVPGKKEELFGRDAWSIADEGVTKLDDSIYKDMRKSKRIGLELHEIFVLLGIESDGIYVWSQKLAKLFPNYDRLESQNEFRIDAQGSGYSCSENECVIRYPTTYVKEDSRIETAVFFSGISPSVGVCRWFGFNEAIASQRIVKHNRYAKTVGSETTHFQTVGGRVPMVELNQEGNIIREIAPRLTKLYSSSIPADLRSGDDVYIYEWISCKRNH